MMVQTSNTEDTTKIKKEIKPLDNKEGKSVAADPETNIEDVLEDSWMVSK